VREPTGAWAEAEWWTGGGGGAGLGRDAIGGCWVVVPFPAVKLATGLGSLGTSPLLEEEEDRGAGTYPINPLCLKAVRRAAETCLSRTRSAVKLLAGVGGSLDLASAKPTEALRAHQASHSIAGASNAISLQLDVNAPP